MKSRAVWWSAAVLVVAVISGSHVRSAASTFSVNPTQVYLSGRSVSALLTLRNQSDGTLRFQLSVFEWTQSTSGEMRLAPTEDIVFFPSLLTLQPSEERRVRIGSSTSAGPYEKTYRIFVEELPPMERAQDGTGAVRVLTKMGIPIFLRPSKEVASAAISGVRQEEGTLRFALANTGTVHFVPQAVRVRGMSGSAAVFERQMDGWYVLAGGRRDFDLLVPAPDCARVTSLVVEVEVGFTTLQQRLPAPGGACAP